MAALVLYAPHGVDLREDGSSSQRNGTVKGLSQGLNVIVKCLSINEKSVEMCYINEKLLTLTFTNCYLFGLAAPADSL